MSAHELLDELQRLMVRPKGAVDDALRAKLRAHKPALLAALRGPEPAAARRSTRPTTTPPADSPPHELSFEDRIESGYVNPGWRPAAWRDRLRELANRCEPLHPDLAASYRRWADNIRVDDTSS